MKAVLALLLLLALPISAATVEGFVYSTDGTPAEKATVRAYVAESSAEQQKRLEKRQPRVPIATARIENGRVALAGLPAGVVEVEIVADGFAPLLVRTLTDDLPLNLLLQRAETVEGRVLARGKPVENAYVVWTGANDVEIAATTNANGRYRLPDPRRWARESNVFHPNFAPLPDGRGIVTLDLELRPRGQNERPPATGNATLTGVVKLGDKPLAGVPLVVHATGERYMLPLRVVTDEKGRYSATGLVPALTYVGVAEGLEPRVRSPQGAGDRMPPSVSLNEERNATLDLTLVKAPLVRGRVVDADGTPVPGAQVQIVIAGRPSIDFAGGDSGRTSAAGEYALPVPPFPETETVQVAVFGHARSTVRSKAFAARGDTTVDITLPRFEAVTLRVLDRERKPAPNARVAFAEAEELATMRDPRFLLHEPFASRAVRADEQGEVKLQLARGTYDFAAEAKGFQTGVLEQQTVAKTGSIEMTLDTAFAIRGRVHRNGVGVANVSVMLVTEEPTARDENLVTDANGRFEIGGLARGEYRVGFFKHDELIQRSVTALAPSTLDVPLPPASVIRGRVLDAATREPVREFMYSIEPLEAQEDPRFGSPSLHRGMSTGDGTFAATLPVGEYRVTAAAVGYATPAPVEVRLTEREPADVTVALERGITLTGGVTDESGVPVEGAEVYVAADDNSRRQKRAAARVRPGHAVSAADGSFTISGLDAGVASVVARKEGFVTFHKTVDVSVVTTLDIRLSRGLTLEGVVTRGGKPVAGVQVNAMTAAVGGEHQPATTDRNGRFVLRGLLPARYTVSAHLESTHAEVENVEPAKQRELAISLDELPQGVIYGTVTGIPRFEGKITRRVVFAHTRERGVEGAIDDAGNFRIENAPAGTVTVVAQVEATTSSRSSQPKQVEVLTGQAVRVELDLGGAVPIRGRVTHDGKPVARAQVVFSDRASVGASATTRADGTYETALPAPGLYHIYVHGDAVAAARPYQAIRELRAGETVDIDIREQTVEGTVVDAVAREPIAHAFVSIVPEAGGSELISGETITDANGRFRIIAAAAGPHRAVASASGYAQRIENILLGSGRNMQFAFELQRIEPLRMRVFDARNRLPLEAHLVVTTPTGAPLPLRADRSPDREWHLFSLAPGKYRVVVVVHGYPEKTVDVTAPGSVDIGM